MGTKGIQRFHCSRCPHRLTYLKGEPRQEGYIVLQFGQQYCTAGCMRDYQYRTVPSGESGNQGWYS